MEVRWSMPSAEDSSASVDAVERDSPEAAGQRELIFSGLPYIVVYRVGDEAVEVGRGRRLIMGSTATNAELLQDLARHQTWADGAHWKALHENSQLLEDPEIQKRLNHILSALRMLTTLARGETPDPARMTATEPIDQLEAAMERANGEIIETIENVDLGKMIPLPRGPQGPWEAPAGVLLLQAITHGQHHRGQNASRMRQLGVTPPMTDFVIWFALGRP